MSGPRRFVVTGGAGFIGSHLVRRLLAEGDVVVVDDLSTGRAGNLPDGVQLIEEDVREPAYLKAAVADASAVFHLAAVASVTRCEEEVHRSHTINLGGTVALIEAVRDAAPAAPVVFASSAAVYGMPETLPLTETAATRPLGFYGLDKLASEHALAMAAKTFGLRATALRLFNVYGPRQDPSSPYSGVISIFVDRLGRGAPTTIHGDGGQTRDFVRAQDVAAHFAAAAARAADGPAGRFEVFNVATGTATTITALHDMVARAFAVEATPAHGPAKAGDIRHSCGDRSAARAALAVAEPVPFADGLPAYVAASAAGGDGS